MSATGRSRPYTSLEEALHEPDRVLILDLSGQLPDLTREKESFPRLEDVVCVEDGEECYLVPGGPVRIHDVLGQFGNLVELDLSGNRLESLPESLGNLEHLKVLNLGNNRLEALPSEIGELRQLVSLNAQENLLSLLPEEIGNCAGLEEIFLDHNRLTTLPAEFGNLVKLVGLDLTKNLISSLPEELSGLRNLRQLSLKENELCNLSPEELQRLLVSIRMLPSLATLDLSINFLDTLPPVIGELANLTRLDLSRNELAALPAAVADLVKLEELFLHCNGQLAESYESLESLFPILRRLSALKRVSVTFGTELLPPWVGALGKDVELQADGRFDPYWVQDFRGTAAGWEADRRPYGIRKLISASYFCHLDGWEAAIQRIPEFFHDGLTLAEQLSILDIQDPLLRVWAIGELAERLPSPFGAPPDLEGAVFSFAGRLRGMNLDDILPALRQRGCEISEAFTGRVTHLVAGYQGGEPARRAVQLGVRLVLEPHLRDLLSRWQPPFLLVPSESSERMLRSLRTLLLNPNPANVLIGLTMMWGGGIPEGFLEILVALFLHASSDAVLVKVRDLFRKFIPWKLQAYATWVWNAGRRSSSTLSGKQMEDQCRTLSALGKLDAEQLLQACQALRLKEPSNRE